MLIGSVIGLMVRDLDGVNRLQRYVVQGIRGFCLLRKGSQNLEVLMPLKFTKAKRNFVVSQRCERVSRWVQTSFHKKIFIYQKIVLKF